MNDNDKITKILVEHFKTDCVINAIARLGGLTNKTFKVTTNYGNLIVRLPGPGTEELISRTNEKVSNMLACDLNIDAGVLYFDEQNGEKISNYIENPITMSPLTIKDGNNLLLVAQILSKLHNCGIDTNIAFDVFGMAKEYEMFMVNNNVALFDDYEMFKNKVLTIKEKFQSENSKLVPCHNDPLCENWIRSKERMYLVDWEYAGMNDAMWDIADVSIEASLNEVQDAELLEAYFGRKITKKEELNFLANKVYLDYLWSLWGKTRVPFDDTMESYALERFVRMKENIKKIEEKL